MNSGEDISSERIKDMVLSHEVDKRMQGLEDLYNKLRDPLYRKYFFETGIQEVAEDIVQDTFVKMRNKLKKGPLQDIGSPEGYVRKTAENTYKDWKKRRKRATKAVSKLLPPVNLEAENEYGKKQKSMLALRLAHHIPNEDDRLIHLLRHHTGYPPEQITLLTGLKPREIQNSIRRSERWIKSKLAEMHGDEFALQEFAEQPTPWENKLAFTGDNNPVCVTYVNALPNNLAHESQQKLMKDLELKSFDEIWKRFACLLRYEGTDTFMPGLHLTFMERKQFSQETIYENDTMYFLDYVPNFSSEKRGGKEFVLTLEQGLPISGKTYGYIVDGELVELNVEFPRLGLFVRKAFSEDYLYYVGAPWSTKPSTHVYRYYPLNKYTMPYPVSAVSASVAAGG